MRSQLRHLSKALFCLACLALVGCGRKGLVGKWAATIPAAGDKPAALNIEFKGDGTVTQTTNVMGHAVGGTYNYVVKDDTITETIIAATMDGKPIKVANVNQPAVIYKYVLADDNLTLNTGNAGQGLALKRQLK